jgi:AraC-like DNA-binding protein
MAQVACRFAFAADNPAGNRCPRHSHPCTEVVLMLSGDGVLHQDGGRHPYRSGTAIVYQPGTEHWIEQHRPGRHVCLGIVSAAADRLLPGICLIPPLLEPVAGLIVRELSGVADQSRLDLLAGLVASYLADAGPESRPAAAPVPGGAANHLAQADALLRAHLDRPLGACELADSLFISPGYLRQIFRQAYGHGPMHHLLALRIEHAKKLLADTAMPVGEVATRCGFASQFHFSRVFRRFAGMPPSRWRRHVPGCSGAKHPSAPAGSA